jgi:hypothetical protein
MDMNAAYRKVGTYRAATEICGTTPKTVKRAVQAARRSESGADPDGVRHNYDRVRDLVAERVAKTQGRISAKRLAPIVAAARYEGSDRTLRRLVAKVKGEWRRTTTEADHLGSGRPATCWSLTGGRSARCSLRRDGVEQVALRLLRRGRVS